MRRIDGWPKRRDEPTLNTFPTARRERLGNHRSRADVGSHHPITRRKKMDWNRIEGNWKQVKGNVKEQWGKLSDDDLDTIAGRREQLEGKIQERYGLARDQVRKQVDDWFSTQKW